jgi:hypothetical protein
VHLCNLDASPLTALMFVLMRRTLLNSGRS